MPMPDFLKPFPVLIAATVALAAGVYLGEKKSNLNTSEAASVCESGLPEDLTIQGEGFSFTLKGVGTELNRQLKESGIIVSRCEQ